MKIKAIKIIDNVFLRYFLLVTETDLVSTRDQVTYEIMYNAYSGRSLSLYSHGFEIKRVHRMIKVGKIDKSDTDIYNFSLTNPDQRDHFS